MLDVKTNAEVKNLNCRVEAHGDDMVPAIDVKMVLLAVPVDKISTLCPDIERHFYDGPQVAIGEVNPLHVGHKVENLKAKIGKVALNGCDLKKGAKIHLLPNKLANVELTVQAEHRDNVAVHILSYLKNEVMVSISERQGKLEGLE